MREEVEKGEVLSASTLWLGHNLGVHNRVHAYIIPQLRKKKGKKKKNREVEYN
jgi:hypothetical protein